MSGDARDWAEQYASLAQDYLASREEAALKRAYEMGRRAVEQGLGVLDVAEAHSRVLISALGRGPTAGEGAQLAETAAEFLVESLAPFEMTHRGFKEVNGELHKLNRILEDRAVELEAANKELEAFSYSVSHDLRAPLRHISGYANMLAEYAEGILDEKGRRFLRVIVDAAKGMETLIAELLNFSRMARAEMRAAQVSLEPIVRDIIGEMSPDMVGRDVEWLIGELPEVLADPSMVRLVMTNLISNAAKYTRKRDHARIEIGWVPEGEEDVFFVRDNGAGFDTVYADKLFRVFQRLHPSDEFEGIGVGLAIVRRIVHRHGGRTWAEGEKDKGAAFYFSLPKPEFIATETQRISRLRLSI